MHKQPIHKECGTCKYFHHSGECRLRPPQLVKDEDNKVYWANPKVLPDYWCGKWEQSHDE